MTSFTSDDRIAAPAVITRPASVTRPQVSPEDLALIIGANPGRYMNRARRHSWHWPAALVPLPWLLYRKMYWECFALLAIALPLRIAFPDFITPTVFPLLILGLSAHALYLNSARRRIRKADRRDLPGARRHRYLARAGGVSWPGAILGTLITASVAAHLLAPSILAASCSLAQLPC
ncbi:MAG: DUF2628 domain-containing protein [Alphaproteobacteria bacterium]